MEEAIANATRLRVLAAIGEAIPVRLMRRDLLFVAERLANLLDENRLNILTKLHGIRRAEEADAIGKRFTANLRRENESTLGRAVLESVMLPPPRAAMPHKRCAKRPRPTRSIPPSLPPTSGRSLRLKTR
jgi:ParB family chromosome partitioning protein